MIYEDYPEKGEVPYSCVWAARGVIGSDGDVQWFKPERLTSGRRDAHQLFAGAGEDVAFAIVWQEDPKGLVPGEGDGPGDGWSGARTNNKTDIWYSYITLADFGKIDHQLPRRRVRRKRHRGHRSRAGRTGQGPGTHVASVKISDNDMCSVENMLAVGGSGEHDIDGEGEGHTSLLRHRRRHRDGRGPGVQHAVRLHRRKNQPQG